MYITNKVQCSLAFLSFLIIIQSNENKDTYIKKIRSNKFCIKLSISVKF